VPVSGVGSIRSAAVAAGPDGGLVREDEDPVAPVCRADVAGS
jgi:hypothetical protein